MTQPKRDVLLATRKGHWIPTESATVQLTAKGREEWVAAALANVRRVSGSAVLAPGVEALIRGVEPSTSGIARWLFVPSSPRALAVVKLTVTPADEGWRETLLDALTHPVGLLRDTEIADLGVAWGSEGFVAVRCDEREGALMATVVLAARAGDEVVVLRGSSPDLLTALEFKELGTEAFVGATVSSPASA